MEVNDMKITHTQDLGRSIELHKKDGPRMHLIIYTRHNYPTHADLVRLVKACDVECKTLAVVTEAGMLGTIHRDKAIPGILQHDSDKIIIMYYTRRLVTNQAFAQFLRTGEVIRRLTRGTLQYTSKATIWFTTHRLPQYVSNRYTLTEVREEE